MSYLITKIIKGNEYNYIRTGYRIGKLVRHHDVYLGRKGTIDTREAIAEARPTLEPRPIPEPRPTITKAPREPIKFKGARPSARLLPKVRGEPGEFKEGKVIIKRKKTIKKKFKKKPEEENKDVVV